MGKGIVGSKPALSVFNLALVSASLLLWAGCEQKPEEPVPASAAPRDDCVESCARHASCVLELRQDLIGTILEGSGDDVKKTAVRYAKQDASELDTQCQTHCKAGDPAKDKISRCDRSSCSKLIPCMGLALPPDDETVEQGPHACVVEAQSSCIEYTGPKLKTSEVKPACRALYEGKYEKATCPRADLVGSCVAAKGKDSERTTYYYSTGKKPHTADTAQAACVGDFKAAATGDAGAPAAAAAATGAPTAAATAEAKTPAVKAPAPKK
jgi:hypothetical protein